MRTFIIIIASVLVLVSPSVAADLKGDWHCVYEEDDYRTTRGIKIVGNSMIETGGFGRKQVVDNPAISKEYVFWSNTPGQEFEFYPLENKLVETSTIAGLKTVLEYECSAK
jgi:hypothetical protein